VNTGDDWQKSQWLLPRLAQGTRVIRQVSCGKRRVGEVGENRSRLTVEQNVFSRALRATPFKRSYASQAVRHQRCVFFSEFNLTVVVAVDPLAAPGCILEAIIVEYGSRQKRRLVLSGVRETISDGNLDLDLF
jgi:hypothetical protein